MPEIVYAVVAYEPYEGGDLLGIFSTEEKAEAFVTQIEAGRWPPSLVQSEAWPLDELPEPRTI